MSLTKKSAQWIIKYGEDVVPLCHHCGHYESQDPKICPWVLACKEYPDNRADSKDFQDCLKELGCLYRHKARGLVECPKFVLK